MPQLSLPFSRRTAAKRLHRHENCPVVPDGRQPDLGAGIIPRVQRARRAASPTSPPTCF